jgi:hypothetical protein
MNATAHAGQPGAFLLVTHSNSVDFADFLALTGVDDGRRIHQVIYVSGGLRPNAGNQEVAGPNWSRSRSRNQFSSFPRSFDRGQSDRAGQSDFADKMAASALLSVRPRPAGRQFLISAFEYGRRCTGQGTK